MMKRYGLIGFPLGHSFSSAFFAEKFQREGTADRFLYSNFRVEDVGQVTALLKEMPDLMGLNVTIPYKSAVIPFLTRLSSEARDIGAVNTICVSRDSAGNVIETIGYNTDVIGFKTALLEFIPDVSLQALVLGTGGSSLAVKFVLRQLGIPFSMVSRTPDAGEISYAELSDQVIKSHRLIINTTPLGMYPEVKTCPPIPYSDLTASHYLFDLVYNPAKTLFLQKGIQAGASVTNGLKMLQLQAEAAWSIWQKNA